MSPGQKRFVKYTFEEGNNKQKEHRQQRQQRQQRHPSRENYRQRESSQINRGRRHVSYTQKPMTKQNVLKDMINSFIPVQKPSQKIQQLIENFPKYFKNNPKQPQPFSHDSLNGFLTLLGKKANQRQARNFVPAEQENQQDPDWDSGSDVETGIESRRIDSSIVIKVLQKMGSVRLIRQDELKKHQKQFLEQHYRQKHQQLLQKQKSQEISKKTQQKSEQLDDKKIQREGQWNLYQEKQVENFINMGFIQKIQEDYNQFADDENDDFSVEDSKSISDKSCKSSEDGEEDQIFGDQGPSKIVKKKDISDKTVDSSASGLGTVVFSNHVFSRIAEAVGIPPSACIWIIRNKNLRYKVSTQFMDEMYKLNNFCEMLPYVSLNHSQFVHNSEVQKQKGLEILKHFNVRQHQQNHNQGNHRHSKQGNARNNQNNKRKFQYKPNHLKQISKSHLNKN